MASFPDYKHGNPRAAYKPVRQTLPEKDYDRKARKEAKGTLVAPVRPLDAQAKTLTLRAEKNISDAEALLESWSLFSSLFSSKVRQIEKAADMHAQAARDFKTAGMWKRAGDSYIKAKELFEQAAEVEAEGSTGTKGVTSEAANWTIEAAKCYKKVSVPAASEAYQAAISLYTDAGRHATAARYSMELGELLKLGGNVEKKKAIKAFEQAAHYYTAADQPRHAEKSMVKAAELCMDSNRPDPRRAIELFEKAARGALGRHEFRYVSKGYHFGASICAIVLATQSEDTKDLEDSVSAYAEIDSSFDGSMEHLFLKELVKAVIYVDKQAFLRALHTYRGKQTMKDWMVTSLASAEKLIPELAVMTRKIDIT